MLSQVQEVVNAVVARAQRQGFVLPREIRAELVAAHLPADLWKEVAALAQPPLLAQRGRYLYRAPAGGRREEEQRQKAIRQAVRGLIRRHRAGAGPAERRRQDRIDFIQTVTARTEDGRTLNLLSRDISTAGIRLIGTRGLLGQKVRVEVPGGDGGEPCAFQVRILWTCAVGDGLYENGGTFLEVEAPQSKTLQVVG